MQSLYLDPTTHGGLHRRVPAVLITCMDKFIEQHADRISGTLGCLPQGQAARSTGYYSGAPAHHERRRDGRVSQEPGGLGRDAQVVPARSGGAAQEARSGSVHKRRPPLRVLESRDEEEDLARKIAERYGITEGLVCVLSVVEPCRTFSLVSERSLTVRSVGEAKVCEIWGSFTSSSKAGSRARFRSTSTATRGWLGNLTVTA